MTSDKGRVRLEVSINKRIPAIVKARVARDGLLNRNVRANPIPKSIPDPLKQDIPPLSIRIKNSLMHRKIHKSIRRWKGHPLSRIIIKMSRGRSIKDVKTLLRWLLGFMSFSLKSP